MLTAPVVLEHPLQVALARVLTIEIGPVGKLSANGVVWWACDIADYGGAVPATRIARGIAPGIPDHFFLWRGRQYCIELKSGDGRLSAQQKERFAAFMMAGGHVGAADNIEDALACVDEWRIPRHRRINLQ